MLLGILSDSHGQVRRVAAAMEIFADRGVDMVIHCGDVGGIETFDPMVGRNLRFVWGNTDVPTPGLLAYLDTVGLSPPQTTPLELVLEERRIQVFHGHEPGFQKALDARQADYLFHGHTHVARDERCGATRVINPGALHRATQYSVATLDLCTDEVTFLPLSR